MRGKGQKGLIFVLQPRITPAYAGKRLLRQLRHITSRDHPRVCGEKVGPVGCVSGWLGSPPRMRGKDRVERHQEGRKGITPAYAGKRGCKMTPAFLSWDHPRVCGEKYPSGGRPHCGGGSPPRMRGKARMYPKNEVWFRITPAYAGKSIEPPPNRRARRDHPRVCGEKHRAAAESARPSGSPPRMRGKGPLPGKGREPFGITPAYAGKRPCISDSWL